MQIVSRFFTVCRSCPIAVAIAATLVIWSAIPMPAKADHCGARGQRACCDIENVNPLKHGSWQPGCKNNLVQGPADRGLCLADSPKHRIGTCQKKDGAGFPENCGGIQEVPCALRYHLASCKPDLVKVNAENLCVSKDDDGFPEVCGDAGERACTILEHLPACKVEDFVVENSGRCIALDCGDPGERACPIPFQPCKSSARPVLSPQDPFRWCVDKESFTAKLEKQNEEEAPPGPRTIFLIHGMNSSRRTWWSGDEVGEKSFIRRLDDAKFGFNVYVVDYHSNPKNNAGRTAVPFRIFALNGNKELVEKHRAGEPLDGQNFSLPQIGRLLSDAILKLPDVKPNVAIVAHSMGGLIARDLVFHHSDELRRKGHRITEVITIATPHRGSGADIPEFAKSDTQVAIECGGSVFTYKTYQACLMWIWQHELRKERRNRNADGEPFIDNLDFPQIRWVTLASADNTTAGFEFDIIPNVVLSRDAHLAASDIAVAHVSAFGIAVDLCYPQVGSEDPPSKITDRENDLTNIKYSNAWIENIWPEEIANKARTPPDLFDYNSFNDFDVSPAALVDVVKLPDFEGTLFAVCHSPGPSPEYPDTLYLADETGRYFAKGDHSEEKNRPPFQNYIKAVLTAGLVSPGLTSDRLEDCKDTSAAEDEDIETCIRETFDVAADLNGDGFIDDDDTDLFTAAEQNGIPDGVLTQAELDALFAADGATPLTLSAPAAVTAEANTTGGAVGLDLGAPTAHAITDPPTLVTSDAPPFFPLGNTTVTWTATDASGNVATATQSVTVIDTTPPMLSLPGAVTAEANIIGGAVGLALGATANDIADPVPLVTGNAAAKFPLGDTTVTWTATDASGNFATAIQTVTVVDTTPPTLSVPATVTAEADTTGGAANVAFGVVETSDIADPAPEVTNDAPALFPLGATMVTWKATDASGNFVTTIQTVTVVDTTPPTLSVPAAVIDEANTTGGSVGLALGAATAIDIADPAPWVTNDAPQFFPLGSTTVTWTATDAAGNVATATQSVTVVDTTPPDVADPAPSTSLLWPPNHRMVEVNLTVAGTDIADPIPECRFAVTSDEPIGGLGGGDKAPDWIATGHASVDIRAERAGTGNGRTYTITVTCTDVTGNAATNIADVSVPHDRRRQRAGK